MAELGDLNATGNGLAAVSGGLQGLLEAYKMKMAQQVQQAQINQSGINAGAAARAQAQMMMPYREGMLNQQAAALAEKTANDAAQRRVQAFLAGMPDPGGSNDGPSPIAFAVRNVLAGNANPESLPKSGPQYMMVQREMQNQGAPDMGPLQTAWNNKMALARPSSIAEQNQMKSVLDTLETMKGLVPTLGLADSPGLGAQSAYAKNLISAHMAGTAANKYLSLMGPQQMASAHEMAGRFAMAELPVMGSATSLNNTGPGLIAKLTGLQNTALERSGLAGKYTPKVISDSAVTPVGSGPAPAGPPLASASISAPAPTVNWQDYAQ